MDQKQRDGQYPSLFGSFISYLFHHESHYGSQAYYWLKLSFQAGYEPRFLLVCFNTEVTEELVR